MEATDAAADATDAPAAASAPAKMQNLRAPEAKAWLRSVPLERLCSSELLSCKSIIENHERLDQGYMEVLEAFAGVELDLAARMREIDNLKTRVKKLSNGKIAFSLLFCLLSLPLFLSPRSS